MTRCLMAVALVLAASSAWADSFDLWRGGRQHAAAADSVDIMKPEPGRPNEMPATPRRKVRGSSNPVYPTPLPQPDHFNPPPTATVQPSLRTVQPYTVSPDSGRALPNLNQGAPETGQDRATRCMHQAGAYGETGGNYLGSCINQ